MSRGDGRGARPRGRTGPCAPTAGRVCRSSAMTNVSVMPGSAGHARRSHRRHRDADPHGHEPLVVDRRQRFNFQFGTEIGGRSRTASAATWSATPRTPGSLRSSGAAATPSAPRASGDVGARRTVARASPGRARIPVTARRRRASATCGRRDQVSSVLFGERELRTIADRAMRAAKGDQTEALSSARPSRSRASRLRPSIRT